MCDKFILSRVNNEGAVFDILTDAQETQVTNASLDNYLVIVLNVFGSGRNQYNLIIHERVNMGFYATCTTTNFQSKYNKN